MIYVRSSYNTIYTETADSVADGSCEAAKNAFMAFGPVDIHHPWLISPSLGIHASSPMMYSSFVN